MEAVLDWDYSYGSGILGIGSKDWNQTLVTRINQVSKVLHESNLKGGADKIIITPRVLEIFKTLEYVRLIDDRYVLSGRYEINVDETSEPNSVFIIQSKTNKIGKIKIKNYE